MVGRDFKDTGNVEITQQLGDRKGVEVEELLWLINFRIKWNQLPRK